MFDVQAFIHVLILLVFTHFLADYPLQGDFLARAKNRVVAYDETGTGMPSLKPTGLKDAIPGVPWWQAMGAHCGIHAGFVYLITSCWPLALLEFGIHWATDNAKCRGRIGFNTDQAIHLACKAAWAFIVVAAAGGWPA